MAFDNVTFFEVHLDGANIGPSFGADVADGEMDEELEMEGEMAAGTERSGGRGRIVGVVALVALAGAAAAIRRRRASMADEDAEMPDVEIEEIDEPVAE